MNETQLIKHLADSYDPEQLGHLFAKARNKFFRNKTKTTKAKIKDIGDEELLPLAEKLLEISEFTIELDMNFDLSVSMKMELEGSWEYPEYFTRDVEINFKDRPKSAVEKSFREYCTGYFHDYSDYILDKKPFSKTLDTYYKKNMDLNPQIEKLAAKYDVDAEVIHEKICKIRAKLLRENKKASKAKRQSSNK